MEPLNATEQSTVEALDDEPATAAEIRERTGRSRSATDKALAELAKAGLATRATTSDTPDGPTRWVRGNPATRSDTPPAEPDTTKPDTTEADTTEGADPALAEPIPGPSKLALRQPDRSDDADDVEESLTPDVGAAIGDTDSGGPEAGQPDTPEVKTCRGCQEQMPVICPCCWQRTPTYCGQCRQTMPARRRGNPDEPQILPNGLVKLTRGELQSLVTAVMRDQPLPAHVGVTGWTAGRIAVFLPGRSTGAIGKVLDRLVDSGHAELLSQAPKLYRPRRASDAAGIDGSSSM